jgi:putative ubiquitin-RnfH superfamily antitoxin RatB of RatAB toxin-antitoxin module
VSTISVTVVYALPERASEIGLMLPSGATVADALEGSRLASIHPEIDLARCAVGIFGRRVERDRVLADGDRVEIYRPLVADPKDARRRRAQGRARS